MPKIKMPGREHGARRAFNVVRDELVLDGKGDRPGPVNYMTWGRDNRANGI